MSIALVIVALGGVALLVMVVRQHQILRRAWSGWEAPDASGYTRFQVECQHAVAELLSRRGLEFVDHCIEDLGGTPPERSIRATLGDTAWTLWIDENAAQLSAPDDGGRPHDQDWINLEAGAHRSPQELIANLVAHVEAVLDARPDGPARGRVRRAVQQADAADEAQGGTRTTS
jgi:hypothetical protein